MTATKAHMVEQTAAPKQRKPRAKKPAAQPQPTQQELDKQVHDMVQEGFAAKEAANRPVPEPVKQPDNWDKAEDWGMKNVRPSVDKWYALPGIIKGLIIFGMVCLFPPLAAAVVLWGVYRWLKFASNLDPNSTTSKVVVGLGAAAALHELKKSLKK